MNYLSEVSTKAQEAQQDLTVLASQVQSLRTEPSQALKDAMPNVMSAMGVLEDALAGAKDAAAALEKAVVTHQQGAATK